MCGVLCCWNFSMMDVFTTEIFTIPPAQTTGYATSLQCTSNIGNVPSESLMEATYLF